MPFPRVLHLLAFALTWLLALAAAGEDVAWRRAMPGYAYAFPRDHYAHPDFKTEWWYFTGHVETAEGRRFGYQWTFFQQGLRPPGSPDVKSAFVRDHFHMAHAAISDLEKERFFFEQRTSRGAFGESGAGTTGEPRVVWTDDWELRRVDEERFAVRAETETMAIQLELRITRPPVFHGMEGVSPKSPEPGNASHYYSHTRLATEGRLRVGDETFEVKGSSWLDREWGTSQLAENQRGWDWLSLQLEDGTDLMVFQLRDARQRPDENASGTLVTQEETVRLRANDFALEPLETWKSDATNADYPVAWRLRVPEQGIDLTVRALMNRQELVLEPIAYWEGAVEARGEGQGGSVKGRGYLEMTGYAGRVAGLR